MTEQRNKWTIGEEWAKGPQSKKQFRACVGTSDGEQKGRESVCNALNYLSDKQYYPFLIDIFETPRFSEIDRAGVDAVGKLHPQFTAQTGMGEQFLFQIKSSEDGVHHFWEIGKEKAPAHNGNEWRQKNLIVLNGQWPKEQFNGDVVAQLIRVLGIPGVEEEVVEFLDLLPEQLASDYKVASSNGLHAHRGAMLEWMYPQVDMRALEIQSRQIVQKTPKTVSTQRGNAHFY